MVTHRRRQLENGLYITNILVFRNHKKIRTLISFAHLQAYACLCHICPRFQVHQAINVFDKSDSIYVACRVIRRFLALSTTVSASSQCLLQPIKLCSSPSGRWQGSCQGYQVWCVDVTVIASMSPLMLGAYMLYV